jgi:hypothetical protein
VGMFDFTMSDEQIAEFRRMLDEAAAGQTHGEDLVAVGAFRRGGATGSFAASKAGGGLAYAAVNLARKKKAGGLPEKVLLAVTPENVYAYKLKTSRKGYRAEREVARWQRSGLRVSTAPKGGLTNIVIESPAENEKVTLVPIGVKDDPVNLELIRLLEAAHPA